ncbi:MAG: MFS transporter [Rhodospirillales bacterium]|jgi:MFS transporter, FSR family, fosmidomycin resistance protein
MSENIAVEKKAKQALATSSGAHAVHDGLSDTLYVLLPVLAEFFGLDKAEAGLIRSAQRAGMSLFQIPVGLWAERIGERNLLVLGTVLAGLSWIGIGLTASIAPLTAPLTEVILSTIAGAGQLLTGTAWSGIQLPPEFTPLLIFCFLLGIGGAVQHPLAQALVSKAYPAQGRRVAVGHYNFWGDAGKLLFTGATSLWIGLQLPWQAPGIAFGGIAILCALIILIVLNNIGLGGAPEHLQPTKNDPRPGVEKGWGVKHKVGFTALCSIKFMDSITRSGFLTFIAFLMIDKGLPKEWAIQALPVVFVGGMLGKLAFGYIAERFGVFKSVVFAAIATGAGIFLIISLPVWVAFIVMAFVGITLNGVSSVLYGTVGDYIELNKQTRAFGFFYTLGTVAGILAPVLIGIIYDTAGANIAMSVVGILPLLVLPLCLILRMSERDLESTKA